MKFKKGWREFLSLLLLMKVCLCTAEGEGVLEQTKSQENKLEISQENTLSQAKGVLEATESSATDDPSLSIESSSQQFQQVETKVRRTVESSAGESSPAAAGSLPPEPSRAEESHVITATQTVATPPLDSASVSKTETGEDEFVIVTSSEPSSSTGNKEPSVVISPSASLISSSTSEDPQVVVQTAAEDKDSMPSIFPPDDVDGTEIEFLDPENRKNTLVGIVTLHKDNPSLQAIEMTSATYNRINPNRVGLIAETTEDIDHFLANRASHKTTGGPLNPIRSTDDDLDKRPRNNDRGDNVPKINDILSGLLSVMGEGLNFATNYVQENNKRKQDEKEQQKNEQLLQQQQQNFLHQEELFPNRNRTRQNNRGPPRISEIPFEAIPLEVLNSQNPGAPPVLFQQRPFQTRHPGGRPPSRQPPPFLSPPPPPPDSPPPVEGTSQPPSLPTRPGYEPGFIKPAEDTVSDEKTSTEISTEQLPSLEDLYTDTSETSTSVETSSPAFTPPSRDNILQNEVHSGEEEKESGTSVTAASRPYEIETSFTPPLLVTPPHRRKRPYRPPRPDGPPPVLVESSVPTPPLSSRPLVFPTRPAELPSGPIVTGVAIPADNDVFDLTVTAHQNFGGKPSKANLNYFDGIITKALPGDQYVSIDGKRTYFEIGGGATKSAVEPTKVPAPSPKPSRPVPGRGAVIGATLKIGGEDILGRPELPTYNPIVGTALPSQALDFRDAPSTGGRDTTQPKLGPTRRPQAPPIRIDTCIVGDDKTCKVELHEVCLTHLGVSSCFCKPGYGRKHHRHICKRTVKLLLSVNLDRMQETSLVWNSEYKNVNSERFQILEGEANYAIDSAMALTSFSNLYVGNTVNTFYPVNRTVTVNTTVELEENGYTKSNIVRRDLENKLVQVIQARANNIGSGNLYASGLVNPIPEISDYDECADPTANDCGENSVCINTFGSFTCQCFKGFGDKYGDDESRAGRVCEACPEDFCGQHGTCGVQDGARVCLCTGNYYGEHCEVDGEVLAVAVGASVAAIVIILLTLICLCMWSRRWKREQEKVEMSRGFSRPFIVGTLPPPPSYHPAKVPSWAPQPSPAYPRWAGHVDVQQNIYAPVVYNGSQEPLYMSPTEPPISIYGTVREPVSVYGTLPRRIHRIGSEFTPPQFPAQYATFRKEAVSARPSLRSLGLMEEEQEDEKRVLDDEEEEEEGSDSTDGSVVSEISLKEKLRDENLAKITRGITFQTLRPTGTPPSAVTPYTTPPTAAGRVQARMPGRKASAPLPQPEPGGRRAVSSNSRGGNHTRAALRGGPLPSLPRPSTALGSRGGNPPLIETSESEDTENNIRIQRPRSSMLSGNLNSEDDFESDYLRYGGTVGVRNPRLVAAMRGVPPYQQQHIQMNMMNNRF